MLESCGVLSNSLIFCVGVDYIDKVNKLKVGVFLILEGVFMVEIVDIVMCGGVSICGIEVVYCIGVMWVVV